MARSLFYHIARVPLKLFLGGSYHAGKFMGRIRVASGDASVHYSKSIDHHRVLDQRHDLDLGSPTMIEQREVLTRRLPRGGIVDSAGIGGHPGVRPI